MKILVVDDSENSRYFLESLLKGNDYEVISVTNGKEGLERLRNDHINLIISDILMPVMDGYQFCRAVKKDSRLKSLPFIFYTATYTDSKDRQLALDIGADRYIRKPLEPKEFIQIIRKVIEEAKKGKLVSKQKKEKEKEEIFKLYSERLVKKLEKKMLELEASEEKYRNLCENVNDVVFSLDKEGRFTAANSRTELFGYMSEDLIGKHFTEILTPKSKIIGQEHFRKAREAKINARSQYEVEIVNKDGSVSVGELSNSSVFEGEKFKGRFGILRDITQRKEAEKSLAESEEKFRSIVDTSPNGITTTDLDGKINYACQRTLDLHGYERSEELLGESAFKLMAPEEKDRARENLEKTIKKGIMLDIEYLFLKKDGSRFYGELSSSLLKDSDGNPKGFMAITKDITQRKKDEEQIRKDLETRNVLLKEIHHRVKNNMQIIVSLLRLQSQFHEEEHTKKVFKDTQSRIQSMAIIHDALYKSQDLARIDMRDYVQRFATHILHLYEIDPNRIELKINTDKIFIDITTGVPCGLIINELVSNAVKHAFPGNRRGVIEIKLYKTKIGKITISVKDNGIGLPDEIDFKKPKTMGLQLINDLSKQLGGTLRVYTKKGLRITLDF